MYPEDRPSWATGVLPEDFVKRAVRLRAAINAVDTQGVERDPLDAMFDDGAPKKRATSLTVEQADQLLTAYSGRIVIFDEVGLNLGRGGMSALRNAMLDLFNQARHLGWLIIYCAQSSRQIPPDLLNGLGVFVKRPLGDEAGTDRDRGPTKEIWEAAVAAFELLRQQPNYAAMPDPRAWAWCKFQDIGQGRRWTGLAPFYQAGHDLAAPAESNIIEGEFTEVLG